jgi:hypothetical protein
VADDAGALLVRSGLVSASALDEARARATERGGTLGEQLVMAGSVSDEALTDFYKSRLLVPQVNPNTLARLPAKVVAVIPADMAIELRAIPVSLDGENNLTVAMSDPSNRHAVDEIAFFTSAYVVRAVATQMQIAWCLAHYYGHVSPLGQRLLQPDKAPPSRAIAAAVRSGTRAKSDTVKEAQSDGVPTDPQAPQRARSISGEIRVPGRRAPSIRPPLEPDFEDESAPVRVAEPSGPVIAIEAGEPSGPQAGGVVADLIAAGKSAPSGPVIALEIDEPPQPVNDDPTTRTEMPLLRRAQGAEPDPPELAARAGEVQMRTGPVREVVDEPRVVIADDLEPPPPPISARSPTARLEDFQPPASLSPVENVQPAELRDISGEVEIPERSDRPVGSHISVEVAPETSSAVVIHEQPSARSEPILLERRRDAEPTAPAVDDDAVTDEVLELPRKRAQRLDRHTQLGVGVVPARTGAGDYDRTRVDARSVVPGEHTPSYDHVAAPPSPVSDEDTSPLALPPSARSIVPPPSGKVRLDTVQERQPSGDLDDDSVTLGRVTNVMTTSDLDDLMPERRVQVQRRNDYDPVDDGWGPPGTTIPPPLLGAIPGAVDGPASGVIPIPNIDSAPLMVAAPVAPEVSRPDVSPQTLVRAFEDASAGMLALIRELEHAEDRDEVVALMITHLGVTHRRTGFFAVRAGEMSLFAMNPRPNAMPVATLRLDRPSTMQDIVGTRLPYRGPMHDDDSRTFLASVLGAAPAEILLVPVAVRERVVGILFGEHRMLHTFDDQLALAARAAGMALERILKARRI